MENWNLQEDKDTTSAILNQIYTNLEWVKIKSGNLQEKVNWWLWNGLKNNENWNDLHTP